MHFIISPTLFRASSYAAALGLTKDQWKASASVGSLPGVTHILPGAPDSLVGAALRNAAKAGNTLVFDHRRV